MGRALRLLVVACGLAESVMLVACATHVRLRTDEDGAADAGADADADADADGDADADVDGDADGDADADGGSSITRVVHGRLYFNHFDEFDDLAKSGAGTWTLEPANSWLRFTIGGVSEQGWATHDSGHSDCVVEARYRYDVPDGGEPSLAIRYVSDWYSWHAFDCTAYDWLAIHYWRHDRYDDTSHSLISTSPGTWHVIRARLLGERMTASTGMVSTTTVDARNLASTVHGLRGLSYDGTINIYWDYLAMYVSETITMTGLEDGQRFRIRTAAGAVVATSPPAGGGEASIDISALAARPPYDEVQVLDSDGSTVICSEATRGDVWGGDIFRAVGCP